LFWQGTALDEERNTSGEGDRPIGQASASVQVYVVSALEDLEIAHEVRSLLA
jgi:acetate kinase